MKRAIVWFRQDLRIHDNEALSNALKSSDEVLPVYVFDERLYTEKTSFGFPKINQLRARFIIESVEDLRNTLKSMGSQLIIRIGKPEEVLFELAKSFQPSWVYCNIERTGEEIYVQDELEKNLWKLGQELKFSRGKMLYHTADLPFPVTHTPVQFYNFRKELEKVVSIRIPLLAPKNFKFPLRYKIEPGDIPEPAELGLFNLNGFKQDFTSGGESNALKQLEKFIWTDKGLLKYKMEKVEGDLDDFKSYFSTYLAQGCLSPKFIYYEINRFEQSEGLEEAGKELFIGLMMRDHLRFLTKRFKSKVFSKGGIGKKKLSGLTDNMSVFEPWSNGTTGVPIVDAAMRQLNQKGYITYQLRRIVADFLVKELKINWQIGAEYFESKLIDYDPCSNWMNWNFVAGLVTDSKGYRQPDIIQLAKRIDPKGIYVRKWISELTNIPEKFVHEPHLADSSFNIP